MKIPMLIGTLVIQFDFIKPISWAVRRKIKRILFVNGKADRSKRLDAIRKFREMTGSGLVDAVKYVNQFFPLNDRVKV
jgi:hypothetical protein